jgi:hypothetical protein
MQDYYSKDHLTYLTISGIRDMIARVNSRMEVMIQGPKRTTARRIAAIFGTKVSVCSWIDVVAWRIETISPTPNPTMSIGAAMVRTWKTPLRMILTANPIDIL